MVINYDLPQVCTYVRVCACMFVCMFLCPMCVHVILTLLADWRSLTLHSLISNASILISSPLSFTIFSLPYFPHTFSFHTFFLSLFAPIQIFIPLLSFNPLTFIYFHIIANTITFTFTVFIFIILIVYVQSAVAYIHRIGRTGRAGKRGTAVTFFTEEDMPRLRPIANVIKVSCSDGHTCMHACVCVFLCYCVTNMIVCVCIYHFISIIIICHRYPAVQYLNGCFQ